MDPAHAALLTQTVTLATVTGRSASGEPTWTAGTAVAARVEEERQEIMGAAGQQVVSSHRIYINGDASPAPDTAMRIWLPGQSTDTQARAIHKVDKLMGLDGSTVDHYEVVV